MTQVLEKICVYALIDPRDGCIRYVGQTRLGEIRLKQHLTESTLPKSQQRKVYRWIRKLIALDLHPIFEVLEVCTIETLNSVEHFWISSFRSSGAVLLNMTDGGDGKLYLSAESRNRIRLAKILNHPLRGKNHRPETIAKMRVAHTGKRWTTEQIERRAAKRRKPFRCVETGRIYPRMLDATAELGIAKQYIRAVLVGKRSAVKGLSFEYV